jgi:fimbrial chaperone protein
MNRSKTSQAVFGLAFLLLAGTALAGSFNVRPTRLVLSAAQPSGMLTLRNPTNFETVVQVQANAWSQQDGADVLEPSRDLIAVPPLFTLPPGGSQVVRIGLRRAAAPDSELTYRLLLREVPPAPGEGFTGLQVALNLSLPVFVEPVQGAAPDLRWDFERSGDGQVQLALSNQGNAHVQLTDVTLNSAGETITGRNLPAYLLPGQRRAWPIDTDASAGTRWTVTATTDAGPVETELVLEAD